MLPLIGSFLLSIAGQLVGRALSRTLTPPAGPAAAPGSASASQEPFASMLAQESQRYASAQGLAATDAAPAPSHAALIVPSPPRPAAAPNFAGEAFHRFDEIQAS